MPNKKKSDKVKEPVELVGAELRNKLIANEVTRLTRIFKDVELSGTKQRTIKALIDEAAFMSVTIKGLKETINEVGPIDEMPQGEYSILRQHPAVQTYNSMIQRYTTLYKELLNLLPPEEKKQESDGFDEFVNNK